MTEQELCVLTAAPVDDYKVTIAPDDDDDLEVDELENEYSGVISGSKFEDTYPSPHTNAKSNHNSDVESNDRTQSVVDNEVVDDNVDEEEEEARSPLLHSIGDPALDFIRKAFTIAYRTLWHLLEPLLKTKNVILVLLVSTLMLGISSLSTFLTSKSTVYQVPAAAPQDISEVSLRLMDIEQEVYSLSRRATSSEIVMKENIKSNADKFEWLEPNMAQVMQGLTKLSNSMANINNQINGYGSDISDISRTISALEKSLTQLQNVVSVQATDINESHSSLDDNASNFNQISGSIDKIAKLIEELSIRLNGLEEAENAEKTVLRLLDEYLPTRLVVSRDKKGTIDATPEFWQYLEGVLHQIYPNSEGKGMASNWEEFLVLNEKAIRKYIQDELNDELNGIQASEIVTKKDFTQSLSDKLTEYRQYISREIERINERFRQVDSNNGAIIDQDVYNESGRIALEKMIRDSLDNYNSKMFENPDFADYVAGARIDRPNTGKTYWPYSSRPIVYRALRYLTSMGQFGKNEMNPPEMAINADNAAGNCWPFEGKSGKLGIVLMSEIYLTDFAIEHTPITANPDSAPKNVSLWVEVNDDMLRKEVEQLLVKSDNDDRNTFRIPQSYVRVAHGKFNVYSKSRVQSFAIPHAIQKLGLLTRRVIFTFEDNWGNEAFTCVYRVRLFGDSTESPDNHQSRRGINILGGLGFEPDDDGSQGFGDDLVF